MRVRILMATLAVTLMLSVQGFANPCSCVDPCGATCAKGGNLFSGLKRLVSGVNIASNCDPCDAVLACSPCDAATCDPCDAACGLPRLGLGGRLRNLLAAPSLCNPCNGAGDCFDGCDPCNGAQNCFDRHCDPCGEIDGCATSRFTLRSLNPFRGLRGCFVDCGPCDGAGNCFDANCEPCDKTGNGCFDGCDPCNGAQNCFDGCGDTSCGPRGHLFDLPRFKLSRLFDGLRIARCNAGDCGPCDEVRPCDGACCR